MQTVELDKFSRRLQTSLDSMYEKKMKNLSTKVQKMAQEDLIL